MFKLRLKNYRGFIDENFNFSRVNILIGENSGGKSSIFKFLLALKQSLRSPYNKESNLTLSGDEIDLGNYYETIYNHEIDRNLYFAFDFQKDYSDFFLQDMFPNIGNNDGGKIILEKKNEILNFISDAYNKETTISFELTYDLSNHKNIIFNASNDSIGNITLLFPFGENSAEQDIYLIGDNPKCELIFESRYYNQTFKIKEIEYDKQAFLTIVDASVLKENIKKYSNLEEFEFEKLFWHIGFLLKAQNYLQMQLSKIEYINPLIHKVAERIYIEGDKKKKRQIKNIKDLIDLLDTSTTKKTFENSLTYLLKDFGIAESFSIKKEKDGFIKEFRVKINGLDSNIKDVGFGVSLQLPIFAQAMISEKTIAKNRFGNEIKKGENLLIEQPEVHLHPSLQAKFIDTLLSIGNNNVYFIETHSEHIIRMLQVLVKTQKYDLKSDDISIHYFKKEGKTICKTMHFINPKTGKLIPNFPNGFYDVSYDLAFQLID